MRETQEFILPGGTICKRNGLPFVLVEDTKIASHRENMPLIVQEEQLERGVNGSATSTRSSA